MADAPTPLAPPPHYAAATASSSASSPPAIVTGLDTFFDIVPQADQTSFQVGYLGLAGFQAWIKGDVLIKLDGRGDAADAPKYSECSIALHAVEADREQSITIFSERHVLWSFEDIQGDINSSSFSQRVPAMLPFSFPLTSDLPHCVHLASSSLSYRLEATLTSADKTVPDAIRSTAVHLTRYTRPGPLIGGEAEQSTSSFMLKPHTWRVALPTPMVIQLQRTLFRRAEPMSVLIRIPPPEGKLLSLSLRSVEANLVRIITSKGTGEKHELLLAHSGKLCRFNSTRTIVLRLHLHPPFDASNMPYPHPDHDAAQGGPINGRGGGGGCESVTQNTLLHEVAFCIRINVAVRSNDGERHDVILEREVVILPGAAGNADVGDSQQTPPDARLKQGKMEKELKAQSAQEDWGTYDGEPSTSAATAAHAQPLIGDTEEEYDGYEDVGRSLSDTEEQIDARGQLLREHDDDAPPPTLLESRHDLQVEVDVAGVGAGVLRPDFASQSDPPPALPIDYVWRSDELQEPPAHDDDPPPPPSPALLDPPIEGAANHSSRMAVGDSVCSVDGQHMAGATQHHRPPPYMASSFLRARRTVSGSQGISAISSLDGPDSVSVMHGNQQQHEQRPGAQQEVHSSAEGAPPTLPPSHSLPSMPSQQPAIALDERLPPAYTHPNALSFGISQHPPSYEA